LLGTRSTSLLICLLLLCAVPAHARAAGLVDEVKIGVLDHDVPDLWSGFRAEPNSVDMNVEALLSPKVSFAGGTLQPAIGASINTVGATSMGYLDARWQYETSFGVFFGLGVGAAVHDGQLQLEDWDRKALGSRVLFHFPAEIGYRFDNHNSVSAYFEHTSNGFTAFPNEGMDRLGIRYGYRFDPSPARESVVPLSSDSYNWTGIYAGVQIGGALGSFSNHWPVQDNYFGAGTGINDATGFFGGGQIGLQQQWGNWVPGIEVAAIQFSNLQGGAAAGGSAIEDEANWSLMLTPRLGYAFDRWLGFAKAGFALTDQTTKEVHNVSATVVDSLRGGWVAGGGIDYALTDCIILGTEYQHIFVGSITQSGGTPPASGSFKLQSDIDTLAARLNFKFYREPDASILK
jgi:lipid A 3-O-deacylase